MSGFWDFTCLTLTLPLLTSQLCTVNSLGCLPCLNIFFLTAACNVIEAGLFPPKKAYSFPARETALIYSPQMVIRICCYLLPWIKPHCAGQIVPAGGLHLALPAVERTVHLCRCTCYVSQDISSQTFQSLTIKVNYYSGYLVLVIMMNNNVQTI